MKLPDQDDVKLFFDILSIAVPGILGLIGVVLVWWAKVRTSVMKAQKELHIAQTALAQEQRKGVTDLPTAIGDTVASRLAEAVGPLAGTVTVLTQANERLTNKFAQLQIDHDRVCIELENQKLENKTYREATGKELADLRSRLSDKENALTNAQETIKTQETKLQAVPALEVRVAQLEQDVAMLKSEKDAIAKERDEAVARAEAAEARADASDALIVRLKQQLSDAEAGRATAEAELLKRPLPDAPKAAEKPA